MTNRMKLLITIVVASFAGIGWWFTHWRGPARIETEWPANQPLPPTTSLTPTPRAQFTPTTRKGYWNIDIVGDFTLPPTKTLTFSGAGRNLSVKQDWEKIFRRGFSSVNITQMTPEEYQPEPINPAFHSRLIPSRRAFNIPGQYFADPPFSILWARNSSLVGQTWFRRPDNDPKRTQSLFESVYGLCGSCIVFGDCPPTGPKITWSKIFIDIENDDGGSAEQQQETANIYTYLLKTIKDNASPYTEVGLMSVPYNGFGYSRAADYLAYPSNAWIIPARQTESTKARGMPDAIVGKTISEVADFQMPGTYFVYPDFDYSIKHNRDGDRHWLAALLQEQEVGARFKPQKRVAWQWLFNTQSSDFPNSGKASNPATPAIAEGVGIFYWFTGAYGAIFWDDMVNLTPDQPTPTDPTLQGIGNDRNYACYEHYIHGLWRLFRHHGDLFNGREKYLNANTECSFDGGKTWAKYNPNQLKTSEVPFARAIVNGNQILVAATMPYAKKKQTSTLKVRYIEDGYQFYTDITLKGDEIFLGRATMPRQ